MRATLCLRRCVHGVAGGGAEEERNEQGRGRMAVLVLDCTCNFQLVTAAIHQSTCIPFLPMSPSLHLLVDSLRPLSPSPLQTHLYMEPQSVVAEMEEDGAIKLVASCQGLEGTQHTVSKVGVWDLCGVVWAQGEARR